MKISEVFRSGLTTEEIESIRARTWHLDCPAVRLTRHTGGKDLVCEGTGEVRVTPSGFLTFKLLTTLSDKRPSELDEEGLVAGVLMPEEKFLDLAAEDVYGRTWKSERLRPDRLISGPSGDVISGVLNQLCHVETLPFKPNGSRFSWWTDEVLEIPANKNTVTKVSIARGKRKPEKHNRNVWSFRCLGIDFLIRPDGDGTLIEATDNQNVAPELFPRRVPETLQFVLGRPVNWSIFRERKGAQVVTRLKSVRPIPASARFHPPIARAWVLEGNKVTSKYHRRLFERYLRHTLASTEQQHHLWGFINTATEVRATSFIDVHGLVLGVAIEVILKREFLDLGAPGKRLGTIIGAAQEYIERWDGPESVKVRMRGLAANLTEIRAADRLQALARAGAINPEYIRAWKRLRNVNAHAFQSGELGSKQIELIETCTVLLYQVIFYAIGYKGVYTDYATPGWPLRTYPDGTLVPQK
jgi:hypothetical protein